MLAAGASGCATHPPQAQFFLLPAAAFCGQQKTSAAIIRSESKRRMEELGADQQTIDILLGSCNTNDSFHTRPYVSVEFWAPIDLVDIAFYYDLAFRGNGWWPVRDRLPDEDVGCYHDWTRVYRKGAALVRVNIHGFLSQYPEEMGGFYYTSFMLDFQGMKPSELLGPNYRNKGKERFDADYHCGTMNAYVGLRKESTAGWLSLATNAGPDEALSSTTDDGDSCAPLAVALTKGTQAPARGGVSGQEIAVLGNEPHLSQDVWDFLRATETLCHHSNKSLWLASRRDRGHVAGAIQEIFGADLPPAFITTMSLSATNWLIVCAEARVQGATPGDAVVRLRIIDRERPYFGTQKFSAGPCTTICGFGSVISTNCEERRELLTIDTEYGPPNEAVPLRQYYAVETDPATGHPVLSLIRMESPDGTPVFGTGEAGVEDPGAIGPRPPLPPPGDADAWVARLEKGDTAQILSTLFFLCRGHSRDHADEQTALSQTIPAALRQKGVLEKLARHPSAWVRDYARRLADTPSGPAAPRPAADNRNPPR